MSSRSVARAMSTCVPGVRPPAQAQLPQGLHQRGAVLSGAGFGESTPIQDITTADIDGLREALLARGLAHKTVQKVLVLLGGIMARAKRKGWIAANPCENAEKVSVRRSDEFNVLDVEQVHAVARAAADTQLAALFTVAAFTGLRQGEVLALRWRHVDFANRI